MRGLILIAAVLLAAPAFAEGPFEGRWGPDAEACAAEPGTSDMVPTEIHEDTVSYYESSCEITGYTSIGEEGSSAWRVTMTCSGEGETWAKDAIFAIDQGFRDGPRQLVEIDMETGAVSIRQACD